MALLAPILRTALAAFAFALATTGSLAAERDTKAAKSPWTQLPPQEREVLAPLQQDWEGLPAAQQQRLRSAARQSPKMQPIQRQRFQERLNQWAAMTPEERKVARETFQGLQKLPPAKQHELRERWLNKNDPGAGPQGAPRAP